MLQNWGWIKIEEEKLYWKGNKPYTWYQKCWIESKEFPKNQFNLQNSSIYLGKRAKSSNNPSAKTMYLFGYH